MPPASLLGRRRRKPGCTCELNRAPSSLSPCLPLSDNCTLASGDGGRRRRRHSRLKPVPQGFASTRGLWPGEAANPRQQEQRVSTNLPKRERTGKSPRRPVASVAALSVCWLFSPGPGPEAACRCHPTSRQKPERRHRHSVPSQLSAPCFRLGGAAAQHTKEETAGPATPATAFQEVLPHFPE